MSERNWKNWPTNFRQKIEITSGLTGLAFAVSAAIGFYLDSKLAGFTGIVLALAIIIIIAWNSIPPKAKNAQECIGQRMSLSEIDDINPKLLKLAVVGASQSGKSTFVSNTLHAPTPERTNKIYAEILIISGNPSQYIALLDGDGSEYVQQFDILKEADIIFIFVDHNSDSNSLEKSTARLEQHDMFIQQIQSVIRNRKTLPILHLLMNKRDLWEAGPHAQELNAWFKEHAENWARSNFSSDFSSCLHSNRDTADNNKTMGLIKRIISKGIPK